MKTLKDIRLNAPFKITIKLAEGIEVVSDYRKLTASLVSLDRVSIFIDGICTHTFRGGDARTIMKEGMKVSCT